MRTVAAALMTAVLLAGCGQSPRVTALAETAGTIVAGHQRLEVAAAGLEAAAGEFCAAPDEPGLADIRAAWDAAMAAWMRVQPVRFGPIREDGRDYRLQFWPDPRDLAASQTRALIEGEGGIDAGRVAQASVAVQGLPAIEYLLYPDEGDALAAFAAQPRRCAALTAIAAAVAATAGELARAWSPEGGDYAARLTAYGGDNRFADADAALSVVVGSLAETVQDIESSKLGWPLGSRGGGEPRPLRVESRRSRRSLANIRDNLAGVETLFTAGGGGGLAALLRAQGEQALADAVLERLERAQTQAGALPAPLYDALTGQADLAPYRELLATTRELGDLLGERLPRTLGVPLGFNFNDGD